MVLIKAVLNKLLLKTENTLGLKIADLSKEIKDTFKRKKKLEAVIAVARTVNNRLAERQ